MLNLSRMQIIVAILLVVTLLVLLWLTVGSEAMTKIYSGVGIAPGIGPRGGAIVSDMKFSYFDGEELQPCDMCPNPVVCPKCPNVGDTPLRALNSTFTEAFRGSELLSMAQAVTDPLKKVVGDVAKSAAEVIIGKDNFLSRPWYKTSVCDSTSRGDYFDSIVYSTDVDPAVDSGQQPPLDGPVGHVAQVHINPSSEHCVRYNELRPEVDYSRDPVMASYAADFGANRSRIKNVNQATITPYMGPVTPVPFDADAQYWAERERVGAAYTKLYGRPSFRPTDSDGRSDISISGTETFLTQPDEAFQQNRQPCDPDYAVCGKKQRADILCCKIPSERTTINLLYNEVMGLPIHMLPAQDKCELSGMNGYSYQVDCAPA